MALWVGIDDTDSPRGGCTTFVLTELLALAQRDGVDLIGEPRLVRLNPNIPWKTRGNAALAARFGRGEGRPRTVGELAGRPVRAYPRSRRLLPLDETRFLEAAWGTVLASSRQGDAGTDPAMVATHGALPSSLYRTAVREVADVAQVRRVLDRAGAWYRTAGSEQGLVGAAAALSWPGRRATWEAISYRFPERWGRPRDVDAASVRRAQRKEPDLFLCFDPRTRRLLVAPHTPCPILYGLRSRSSAAPIRARRWVRSEPVERWVLFRTNQGTGDHLIPRGPDGWTPHVSGWVRGVVDVVPARLRGGHVRFSVRSGAEARYECVAFEPTKTLPAVARELLPGDEVRVWGSRGAAPALHIEALEVLRWAAQRPGRAAPRCGTCQRTARSLGRQRGFACPGCGQQWPPEAGIPRPRSPPRSLGRYDPTPSARRHLAPLAAET